MPWATVTNVISLGMLKETAGSKPKPKRAIIEDRSETLAVIIVTRKDI